MVLMVATMAAMATTMVQAWMAPMASVGHDGACACPVACAFVCHPLH